MESIVNSPTEVRTALKELGVSHLNSFLSREEIEYIRYLCYPLIPADLPRCEGAHWAASPGPEVILQLKSLICSPAILVHIQELLGHNIRLSFAEYCLTLPESNLQPWKLFGYDSSSALGFHRDGGLLNTHMVENMNSPICSVKAAIWLSDTHHADAGNLYVIPGSHTASYAADIDLDKAIPIMARKGDVTLFDRRIFHSRSPNSSNIQREVLFLEYSYRWLRRKFPLYIRDTNDLSPLENQILGTAEDPWELYWPSAKLPLEDLAYGE